MGKRDKCYKRDKNTSIHNKGILMLYEPSHNIFKDKTVCDQVERYKMFHERILNLYRYHQPFEY